MNTDGMVEVAEGSFSLEPMLRIEAALHLGGRRLAPGLSRGWMPVPSVIWESRAMASAVKAQAAEDGDLRVRYRFENLTERPLYAHLFVLVRPFQVTPPWQISAIWAASAGFTISTGRDGAVRVNAAARSIVPEHGGRLPAGFGAMRSMMGSCVAYLLAGTLPGAAEVHDPFGFATGRSNSTLSSQAGQHRERVLGCVPLACAATAADAACLRLDSQMLPDPMVGQRLGRTRPSMRR